MEELNNLRIEDNISKLKMNIATRYADMNKLGMSKMVPEKHRSHLKKVHTLK